MATHRRNHRHGFKLLRSQKLARLPPIYGRKYWRVRVLSRVFRRWNRRSHRWGPIIIWPGKYRPLICPAPTNCRFMAADRDRTFLEAMIGESDHSNYELASSTLPFPPPPSFTSKDEIALHFHKRFQLQRQLSPPTETPEPAERGRLGTACILTARGLFDCADSEDFTFSNNELIIDLWIRRNTTGAETLFGQQWRANYTPAAGYFTAANKVQVYFYTGTTSYTIISTKTITDTTWHHIVMGRSSNGILYIDECQKGRCHYQELLKHHHWFFQGK